MASELMHNSHVSSGLSNLAFLRGLGVFPLWLHLYENPKCSRKKHQSDFRSL